MTIQKRHRPNHGRHFAFKNQLQRADMKLCQVCGQPAESYFYNQEKQAKTWKHRTQVVGRGGKRLSGESKYCELPIDSAVKGGSGF